MKRRAQAALEFLTTYGWALLVILVMIGALVYFGVLNPTKVLPNKCDSEAGFACKEYQATTTSLTVNFVNKVGEAINFVTVNGTTSSSFVNAPVSEEGAAPTCGATWIDSSGASVALGDAANVVPPDATFTVSCTGSGGDIFAGLSGEKVSVDLEVGYKKVRGSFGQTFRATVFTAVQ